MHVRWCRAVACYLLFDPATVGNGSRDAEGWRITGEGDDVISGGIIDQRDEVSADARGS